MKLWGRKNSVNVKKPAWCAAELGVELERVDLGGPFGGLGTPEFLAKNPNGLIPCLEDGELVLWESHSIVRYLADAHGAGRLASDSAAARARCGMWMDWALGKMAEPYRDLIMNLVRGTPETRDEAAIERGLAGFEQALRIADGTLARQPWLSGETFGVGDIPLGAYAYLWFTLDIERPELPNVGAWYEKLTQRSAYREHVMLPIS
ncbi:glutathione S-transferase family protein [Halomonas borealis]|uniref:glutathione S-transferase family protein n=1 Tax=Halomonas borealis TaxID=2508710 RepID=UPI0010A0889C|nr:glutathione S-transferase [Halomonas borealis]